MNKDENLNIEKSFFYKVLGLSGVLEESRKQSWEISKNFGQTDFLFLHSGPLEGSLNIAPRVPNFGHGSFGHVSCIRLIGNMKGLYHTLDTSSSR